MRIAVFASGNGSNFEAIVEQFERGTIQGELVCLFSDQEQAYAIERAKRHQIPYYVLPKKKELTKADYEKQLLTILEKENIELIVLAGYMRILGETLLNKYPKRIINLHPSLLPKFPGKQGIKEAFFAKERETGITIHIVDSGIDTGPIIFQKKISLVEDETLEALERRIHALEHYFYPKIIADFVRENTKNE